MIQLTVKEVKYKRGESWRLASIEESKGLIASIDLEDDESCPVIEKEPEDFYFARDITVRFYSIKSTILDESNVDDFSVLETLLEMKTTDPEELRYWFHDVPCGKHILETAWSEPDTDEDKFLEYRGTYEDF